MAVTVCCHREGNPHSAYPELQQVLIPRNIDVCCRNCSGVMLPWNTDVHGSRLLKEKRGKVFLSIYCASALIKQYPLEE